MDAVDARARAAAAGLCALISSGDDNAARELLSIYLAEVMPVTGPMMAMQRLVSAVLGVAVSVTEGPEPFHRLAECIAVSDGEWV